MNAERGGIVTEGLRAFERDCKYICNLIKAEISGNRGEEKAFESLSRIRGEHTVLRNIELSNDAMRSELDAVVVTRNGAFIIEVKNTSKNIFIDAEGNYYRTGEFLKWDSNIGEKMRIKKELLRIVLDVQGLTYMPIAADRHLLPIYWKARPRSSRLNPQNGIGRTAETVRPTYRVPPIRS